MRKATETFYYSIIGVLSLILGVFVLNSMFNPSRIADKINNDTETAENPPRKTVNEVLLFLASLPVVAGVLPVIYFLSVYEEFKYQGEKMLGVFNIPFLNVANVISKIVAGYGFREASPLKQVSKSITPPFFIHGKEDSLNPLSMAQELYTAAKSEKELWIVPSAGHGKAFDNDPDGYFLGLETFIINI